jgi:TolA-binding protein
MKRKDLIKKLEKKEKELKVAIDMGEKIGEEMVKTLSKHVYALIDLNNQLDDVQGKLKQLKGNS